MIMGVLFMLEKGEFEWKIKLKEACYWVLLE